MREVWGERSGVSGVGLRVGGRVCVGRPVCPRRVSVRTAGVLAEVSRELHLDGAAAGDDRRVLEEAARVHDRVVERALGLLDELRGEEGEG